VIDDQQDAAPGLHVAPELRDERASRRSIVAGAAQDLVRDHPEARIAAVARHRRRLEAAVRDAVRRDLGRAQLARIARPHGQPEARRHDREQDHGRGQPPRRQRDHRERERGAAADQHERVALVAEPEPESLAPRERRQHHPPRT